MDVIAVDHLGKAYKQYPNRWARLEEWLLPFAKPRHQLKWVLQEVSFTVQAGEAVGIIGINGAGKSTLLKIITGTTRPTTGTAALTGRVAALLELGMGFHPDFTGRQNVFMAGQLLGYSAETIARLLPEIEAFAEIGDYLDQPVRVYSSGMQMRLAFSVATAERPDILIIDEALSVGDAYFQHKSFAKIREFRQQGTTLLIVSHDKAAIQAICDRAILLNAGRMEMAGSPETVMDYYNALLGGQEAPTVRQETLDQGKTQTISGTGEASVTDITLLNEQGDRIEVIDVGQQVILQIKIAIHQDIPELVLGYMLKDRLGQTLFGTNLYHLQQIQKNLSAGETLVCEFAFPANLGDGNYSIATALHTGDTHYEKNYQWRDLALIFTVVNMSKRPFIGLTWLEPALEILR